MNREETKKRVGRLLGRLAPAVAIAAVSAGAIASHSPDGASLANVATTGMEAPAAQSTVHPVVGVQDSWPANCWSNPKTSSVPAVDSPYWGGLHATSVRWSPTWDIAYQGLTGQDAIAVGQERSCFNSWLGQLTAKGVSVEVAFKPDYCYENAAGCPNSQKGQVIIPPLSVYQAAMQEFLAAYPQVKIIAPWGEPDFQPSKGNKFRIGSPHGANFGGANCRRKATAANCGPALAAQMWVTVRKLCPSCTVIAGDLGSNKNHDRPYLSTYRNHLRDGNHAYHPDVWAIHPYTDVTTWEWEISHHAKLTAPGGTLVASFASWLAADGYHADKHIWLDEVSSFTVPPYGHATYSRSVQARAAGLLLTRLPQAGGGSEPRVTRIYYMRFAGKTPDALIVSGRRQRIYWTVAKILKSWAIAPAAATAASAPARSAAVTSYEIRNHADGLCLDANDKGPSAGQNGDRVQLWTCYGGASQKWVPEYQSGQLARLVSVKYPGMCLNADNVGGLANGRKVQLWACYNGGNELWNFGSLTATAPGAPLFLGIGGSQSLALDANKYHLGNGDKVQVWAYYGGSTQLWSAVAA